MHEAAPAAADGTPRVTVFLECTRSIEGHPVRVRMAGRMSDPIFRKAVDVSVACPLCAFKMDQVGRAERK